MDNEIKEKRAQAVDVFARQAIPTVFLNETARRLERINPEFDPNLMEAYQAGFCYALELVLNGDLNFKEITREKERDEE